MVFKSELHRKEGKVLESIQKRATKLVKRSGKHFLRGKAEDTWVAQFREKEAKRQSHMGLAQSYTRGGSDWTLGKISSP